jgi:phosphoribosyl 1,2-cyclic phosphate phosphodiesterase
MTGLRELVFLGTGVSSGVPLWYCTCQTCEKLRKDPTKWRTRSSIALLGEETTLIDASTDISFQLNRESISEVDNLFLTHWHQDHVQGLGYLAEAVLLLALDPINVYLPEGDIPFFEKQMHYAENQVELHPVRPGMNIELVDATFEVVKTKHTHSSVGYIVNSEKRFAYLLDTGYPSSETIERMKNIDFLIVDATLDFVDGKEIEIIFSGHLTLDAALQLWREVGCPECFFTHFAYHGVRGKIGENVIAQGINEEERLAYQLENPGLVLAYDGLRISLR